jgi:hypothetical protein
MTLPTPLTVDRALLSHVREVTKSDRTLGTAIHDGAAVLGIEIRWHESDVLAEAVRQHYDTTIETFRILHPDVSLDWYHEREAEHVFQELVTTAAAQGYGLVSQPVETIHAIADFGLAPPPEELQGVRRSPAWTEDQVDDLIAKLPGHHKIVVLTGHFRALAKAS